MESNFSDKDWIGEFFLPNQLENRFFGKVTYSPENGVLLSYRIAGSQLPNESNLLYGVLDSGENCTLIGEFRPAISGTKLFNGLRTRNGTNGFKTLVVGAFLDEGELFSKVSFSLTGMQEFFFPKGYKDLVKFSNEPMFSATTNYGQIEVGNNAKFAMVGNDITAQIYNSNEEALMELNNVFEKISNKYENSIFMLKRDIAYRVTIKTTKKSEIDLLLRHVFDISNLFAILVHGPIYPELVELERVDDGNSFVCTVFPSTALERKTLDLCKRERSHFRMPITKSNIDLSRVITSYLEQTHNYTTIVSSLQHETGFRDEHSLHGELVMYATQFESISHTGGKNNSDKYEYPVSQFGTDKIKTSLMQIFSNAGENDFGKGIGDLRNEIAHVGKPKVLLSKLSLQDMVRISQLLQLTILGYVLKTIGIDGTVITKYQEHFTP